MATKTKATEIPVIVNEDLRKALDDKIMYKRMIEEIEAIVKGLDEQIKTAIEESGETTIICGDHKASLSTYVRESVSAKDVKKYVSEEVYEEIVSRTMTTRLTVK